MTVQTNKEKLEFHFAILYEAMLPFPTKTDRHYLLRKIRQKRHLIHLYGIFAIFVKVV